MSPRSKLVHSCSRLLPRPRSTSLRLLSNQFLKPFQAHPSQTCWPSPRWCMNSSTPKMASTSPTDLPKNATFTQSVVKAMRALYPEDLADKAWDNVGLLLGNMDEQGQTALGLDITPVESTVLLTNDLTPGVAKEAIKKKASVIVSYHPFIFRGLKSVDVTDPQQRILLQLTQKNIAVYCPHTAVDAVPNGLNEWLVDILTGGVENEVSRSAVQPIAKDRLSPGFEGSGYGRMVEFKEPIAMKELVQKVAKDIGVGQKYVMVAAPKQPDVSTRKFKTAAVCAGSGWGVLKGCSAEVLVTGEMSHHDALRATMEGKVVLTVFHSNSERAYLTQRMAPALTAQFKEHGVTAKVLVSEMDADPYDIWDATNL